jgi:hypothetical protein
MKKLKTIIACLAVVALSLALSYGLGALLAPAESRDSINSIEAFHSLEPDSMDVIVFGTSHAWKGFDPTALTESYGLKAYNYAGNWQAFNTTYMFLQDAFRTQHPKYVLIDTYTVNSMLEDINMEGQIYYTRAVSDFPGKREFLKECFGNRPDRYISYYFPIVMFHENWTNLERSSFGTRRTKEYYLTTMGYDSSTDITPINLDLSLLDKQEALPEKAISYLDKMVKLCEDNGCTPIFYTCPFYGEFPFINALQDYAANHNCYYCNLFDHMEEMELDPLTDFRDSTHLNDSGAKKAALYLGSYITGLDAQ